MHTHVWEIAENDKIKITLDPLMCKIIMTMQKILA